MMIQKKPSKIYDFDFALSAQQKEELKKWTEQLSEKLNERHTFNDDLKKIASTELFNLSAIISHSQMILMIQHFVTNCTFQRARVKKSHTKKTDVVLDCVIMGACVPVCGVLMTPVLIDGQIDAEFVRTRDLLPELKK